MSGIVGLADLAALLRRVLPLPWMYRLARLNGTLVYWLRPAKRHLVARNLAPFAQGDGELRSMTRKFFQYRQTRVLMLLLFREMSLEERRHFLDIDGLAHLDDALSAGKGAVLLSSHLNSLGLFILFMTLRQRGYDVQVALPSDDELFQSTRVGKYLQRRSDRPELKDELGGFFVQFNVRPIVKRLADNVIIGQTGDGWHSTAFAKVPFLDRSLPFTTGMMSIAQTTGAMIVPCTIVGAPPNIRCVISPPFRVPKSDDATGDLVRGVARFVAAFERDLRDNLLCWEHWLIEDTLETMETWPGRPLQERLEV